MRLAVEVTTCTSSRAGIGYYTEHLVDALMQSRQPHDDVILLSNRAPDDALARRWSGHLVVGGSAVRAVWLQTDVPRMLVASGADVAVFPNYIVPLSSPCPTISVVHDLAVMRTPELFTWRKRVVTQSLLGRSVASAAAVATVSEASRRDITTYLGVPPERVVLLPGAAHPSCGPVSAAEIDAVRAKHHLHRPYILTVGTIEPRKNLLTLLSAFDQLLAVTGGRGSGAGAPDFDLVVVGGRGWRDRQLIDELKSRTSQGHVRWLGYVPEKDLIALYGGARLFVYPSRLEGFGLPVLEAMRCGAPVVASDVPALREVAGNAADFVPAGDVGALAGAIIRLLSDPARADRMRSLGYLRAQHFSWERTADRLWKLAHGLGPAREPKSRKPLLARFQAGFNDPLREGGADGPAPSNLSTICKPVVHTSPIGSPPVGLTARQWALLAAIVYADLFDSPLPIDEVGRACIGVTWTADEARRAALEPPLARHITWHDSGYLMLNGRDELVARRQEGIARTAVLLDRHRHTLKWLATLPFVRMLAFSGGTTHQNPGRKPDIDLFVITETGHLYAAYSLLVLFTKLTRTRDVVCPNYLVDQDELLIAYHHDLFTAHQLLSARALSGPEAYQAFCEANKDWVRDFYPGFQPREVKSPAGQISLQRLGELVLSPFMGPVEAIARSAWRFYLGRRAATARRPDVVFADGILKLHLSDYRRRVLDRFAARLDAVHAEMGREGSSAQPLAVGS